MSGPRQFSFANVEQAAPGSTVAEFGVSEPYEEPSSAGTGPLTVDRVLRRPAKAQGSKPSLPVNVVKLAKQRLAEVKRELRRMKSLEKERAQLERLIEAAENKPRAVVRDIKTKSAG